jgi:hypothetical protein
VQLAENFVCASLPAPVKKNCRIESVHAVAAPEKIWSDIEVFTELLKRRGLF